MEPDHLRRRLILNYHDSGMFILVLSGREKAPYLGMFFSLWSRIVSGKAADEKSSGEHPVKSGNSDENAAA